MHFHRLGERCRCGHLTVPARFYTFKGGVLVGPKAQGQAEESYLEHLKEHMPKLYAKLATYEEPSEEKPHATIPSRLRGRK